MCLACSKVQQIDEESSDHIYPKNYEWSSKAMEADTALFLYTSMFYNPSKQLTMRTIVTDDDSTMRTLLRYTSKICKRGRMST